MSSPPVSHQTVRLARGRHTSPADGACVVELASMLAGEPFSDHPASVCPVIASFLRVYNDTLDDARRQDLYPWAAEIVDSASGSEEVLQLREGRLIAWGFEQLERRNRRGPRWLRSRRRPDHEEGRATAGLFAVRAIRGHRVSAEAHESVGELLAELVALGRRPVPAAAAPGAVLSAD